MTENFTAESEPSAPEDETPSPTLTSPRAEANVAVQRESGARRNPLHAVGKALSPTRVSALYVLVAEIIIFSLWAPETFPKLATVKQVLDGNAVIGLAALALAVPLASRVFDLSFAYTMSLAGVTAAHFVAVNNWPLPAAILLALLISLVVGVINAIVVVVLKVNSMIGTLGTGSIIQALISYLTKDQDVTGARLFGAFSKIGQHSVGGIILPVFYLLILAIGVWFVLGHTPLGRRIYATGFNTDAARLSGIKTKRIQFCSLLVSAVLAGWAGISLASVLGSGSTTAGTPYLLPAFAAAFLGETQIMPGRVNAWGTILGVLALGTGITGLSLSGAPSWASNMFTGVVLIAALATNTLQRRPGGLSLARR